MGLLDNIRTWWNRRTAKPLDDGTVERAFNVVPAVSRAMKQGIELWYALYMNEPPWETDCVKPLGIARGIGRELARFTLAEFNVSVSGGPRAEFINDTLQRAAYDFDRTLELGLCLGGVAIRPYVERGQLFLDVCGATAFSPTDFDGNGNATGGVFRETITYNKEKYTRLEYHGFEYGEDGTSVYVVRNKAYKGDTGGGTEIQLNTVPKWADILPEQRIENLEKPLFAYFKNPTSNTIDPSSQVGISVYGTKSTIELLQQADEQWELIRWEFKSGERKVFAEGEAVKAGQFADRLFERGNFTPDGDLFQVFDPAFRDDSLYRGLQYILRLIEDEVGLARFTFSDSEYAANPKTATEIVNAKEKQRKTVKSIQSSFQNTLDGVIYAINAYCDLWNFAPAGEYETAYQWGDGVLNDPDTLRQDMAMDIQRVSAGLMKDVNFVMKWDKVDEETAKAMLPKMEDMATETEEEIE